MLHKFLNTVKRASSGSEIDLYYGSLHNKGLPGAPTIEEAKKDYRQFVHSRDRSPWM